MAVYALEGGGKSSPRWCWEPGVQENGLQGMFVAYCPDSESARVLLCWQRGCLCAYESPLSPYINGFILPAPQEAGQNHLPKGQRGKLRHRPVHV